MKNENSFSDEMKYAFSYCLLLTAYCLLLLSSCKPPLPVYFDMPIGTKMQGFDTIIAGNYLLLDDLINKGTKEFSEKYIVRYDKIIPRVSDTSFSFEMNSKGIDYGDIKNLLGIKDDSEKKNLNDKECDSIFYSLCSFNDLVSAKLCSDIDKNRPTKPVAGMLKITYDRIFFIAVDSLGNNIRDTLLSINSSVLLTKYAEKYFLNFKTEHGWEILQLEIWEHKFLSIRPFYFTSYNKCAKNVLELTASTENIYPGLKPILNKEKKIIGFKASINPKLVVAQFKKSEEVMLLMKL
jgi:hypothetical protein